MAHHRPDVSGRSAAALVLGTVLACRPPDGDGPGAVGCEGADTACDPEEPLVDFTPSGTDAALLDPERGFFDWIDLTAPGDLSTVRAAGFTLAYAGVVLEDYRDRDLDDALLNSLDQGFAAVREAGIKVVLRFTYTGEGIDDAPLDRILAHIEQLEPTLQANADVIAVMQAGFIGAWGEWHSSTNGNDTDEARGAVLGALLDALPEERMVQVRKPDFKRRLVGGPVSEGEAWTGTDVARVGHHNDCFLASDTDMGTYDEDDVEGDKAFIAEDARYVPVGGETCAYNPPRSDCGVALAEMAELHWSFVNALYHPDVLAAWAEQGCSGEIARSLGHRLVVESAKASGAVAPGGILKLAILTRNDGWAAPYAPRGFEVALRRGATTLEAAVTGIEPRGWAAGTRRGVKVWLRVPADAEPGDWTLSFGLPDPLLPDDGRYALRLAVDDASWDEAGGRVVLTDALRVDPSAAGEVDPDATTFEAVAAAEFRVADEGGGR